MQIICNFPIDLKTGSLPCLRRQRPGADGNIIKIKIPYFELKEFLQNNLIRNSENKEINYLKAEVEINNIINKYKKEYGDSIRSKRKKNVLH